MRAWLQRDGQGWEKGSSSRGAATGDGFVAVGDHGLVEKMGKTRMVAAEVEQIGGNGGQAAAG
ncbi:hypothetical protein AMTR_s00023p00248770 [Amborella trichopoda]|uniref:Uncharacterized protein n=1 Tax=Amborella trichopoda TaxID=13333 RepID=W1NKL4_AMBTC|nr:hypothetical protein AMTR_s00023p00248770 [Amborella trichopoda]